MEFMTFVICDCFSYLLEHTFKHNFADTVNPLCSCTLETENTDHFFLHCQNICFHNPFEGTKQY